MKIDPFNIQKALEVYNNASSKTMKRAKINKTQKRDNLILSDNAKNFSAILNKLKEIEDIRYDKVQEIKDKVDKGTYKINSEKIADKIIESSIKDKKINT